MERPNVVIYGMVSVDGRLTVAPDVLLMNGDERWTNLAGSSDVEKWLRQIHKPNAYLEGSNSLVSGTNKSEETFESPKNFDEQEASDLQKDFLPTEVINRSNHKGWFIMVDSRGKIKWKFKEYPSEEWVGWHVLVLVSKRTPLEHLKYLQSEKIPYLISGTDKVNLIISLEKMRQKLNINTVLVTSCGKLGGALLRLDLVDEINIEFMPFIVGGKQTPTLFESPDLKFDELPNKLELISTTVTKDGHVWVRYEVVPYKEFQKIY